MITRRKVLLAIATTLLAMPLAGETQNARKIYRVGYLGNSSASLEPDLVEAFRQGMRDLGYIEGKNLVIEFRWAEGRYDRFASLVTDLIHLPVDVIVTAGTPGTLAAKNATKTIPVVMAVSGDAVGTGLVESLARPGGNVTGLTTMASELEGKRLELLREIAAQARAHYRLEKRRQSAYGNPIQTNRGRREIVARGAGGSGHSGGR